ncbi:MAG TPA: MFS transporter [Candidatus Nitrosocosmicus sp.]
MITLIIRPVGGVLFGHFGDNYGRKKPLIITIMGFSIATFTTGLLPTWQTVGIFAPVSSF